jgi:hypothetical protein
MRCCADDVIMAGMESVGRGRYPGRCCDSSTEKERAEARRPIRRDWSLVVAISESINAEPLRERSYSRERFGRGKELSRWIEKEETFSN